MIRTRRLRNNPISREMISETKVDASAFIYPYFVVPGKNVKQAIDAMPGIHRFSIDTLLTDIEETLSLGLKKILLFGVGEEKSDDAHTAYHEHSIVAEAVRAIRNKFGSNIYIITDVCLCAYTNTGHCGIVKNDEILNDESLPMIARMALSHARAGADMVAPSDMMDGRISAIRQLLDENHFEMIPIMSYSTKFASAYYGPFREAADSAPNKGDRKSYQMDVRNANEALRESLIDEDEGADVLMVKPALAYLDIIKSVSENTLLPVACYNVSAEYSMVKAAATAGFIDEQKIVMENMLAFTRSGARLIITYHAKDIMKNKWL